MNFPAKVLIFNEATEKSTNFDGLTPVFLDVFRSSDITLYAFFALRFVASLPFSAYAASTNALNAVTLSATTILPRKARRDPTLVLEDDASLCALAYDTPPAAPALL